jgi:hypothetical protein
VERVAQLWLGWRIEEIIGLAEWDNFIHEFPSDANDFLIMFMSLNPIKEI